MYHTMFFPEEPHVMHTYPHPWPVRYRILLNWPVRACETMRVGSDTIYNTPATLNLAIVTPGSYLES
jgi:hypothetical protein